MLSQADKQGCGADGFATAKLRAKGKNEHRVCYNTGCSYNSCLCRAVQLLEKRVQPLRVPGDSSTVVQKTRGGGLLIHNPRQTKDGEATPVELFPSSLAQLL